MVIAGSWENPTRWTGLRQLTLQHGLPVIRQCWSECSRRFSCLNPSNVEGLHRLPEQNVTVSYSVITGVKLRFFNHNCAPPPIPATKVYRTLPYPSWFSNFFPKPQPRKKSPCWENGCSLRRLSAGLRSWEKEKASRSPWGEAWESRKDQKPHVGRGSSKNRRGLCPHAIGRPKLLASVCSDTGTGVNFMGRQRLAMVFQQASKTAGHSSPRAHFSSQAGRAFTL